MQDKPNSKRYTNSHMKEKKASKGAMEKADQPQLIAFVHLS
jgi:hypothetical protein